ncbi:endonuclease VII [Mycobacterium phage Danforth]|nr:endonuclease VII [Mycobacterium phage Danforth]
MATVECKDCIAEGITNVRKPALTRTGKPVPGKRCVTHHRARKQTTRDSAWERRLMDTYGITAEEYWAIYEFQLAANKKRGLTGACYICGRATGKGRKKLSVDHCHTTGFVRGLLCGPCNRDVVGHLRDDPTAFTRGFTYLTQPPAFDVIGKRFAPIESANAA